MKPAVRAWTILVILTSLSLSAADDPPKWVKPNDINEGNVKLQWEAGTREENESWRMSHWLKNRAERGHLHVLWRPGIYDGFVPAGQIRGSDVDAGPTKPAKQSGEIRYGKEGKKEAHSFKSGEDDRGARKITTKISLTVEISGKNFGKEESFHKDIALRARCDVSGSNITYTVNLLTKDDSLLDVLRVDWQTAASPELVKVIRKINEQSFKDQGWSMRFNRDGAATYEVETGADSPVLRHGWLVVSDKRGQRLGAAFAPAYGPPDLLATVVVNDGKTITLQIPDKDGNETETQFAPEKGKFDLLDMNGKEASPTAFQVREPVRMLKKEHKITGIRKIFDK